MAEKLPYVPMRLSKTDDKVRRVLIIFNYLMRNAKPRWDNSERREVWHKLTTDRKMRLLYEAHARLKLAMQELDAEIDRCEALIGHSIDH